MCRLVGLFVLVPTLAGATPFTIDTGRPTAEIRWFGAHETSRIGQSFTLHDDARLDLFTFWFAPTSAMTVTAHVQELESGTLLYSSSPIHRSARPFQSPLSIRTGGLALLPATTYVAYLEAVGNGRAYWGLTPGSSYTNGAFVYDYDGALESWALYDSAVTLEFNWAPSTPPPPPPVMPNPEPGTWLLIGGGLALWRKWVRS